MDDLTRLVAIEEIKQLKARYHRALDAGRWDDFAECLTEDFSMYEDGLPERIHGRDRNLDIIRPAFRSAKEQRGGWHHYQVLPEIQITSDETATGLWTLIMSGSWYEDRYRKEDGRWKLCWTHVHVSDERRAQMQQQAQHPRKESEEHK